jgi:hypothetical protein
VNSITTHRGGSRSLLSHENIKDTLPSIAFTQSIA